MKRGSNEAETCRLNGWKVGDRLVGTELGRTVTLLLTAIGERGILARVVDVDGIASDALERSWTLVCREWVLS